MNGARIRLPTPLPSLKGLAEFSVFISYRADQLKVAERLERGLAELGFRVLMIKREQYRSYPTEQDLVRFLRSLANEADAICVVLSEEAVASRWIGTEIGEAARVLGRVVFVSDPSLPIPESFTYRLHQDEEELTDARLVIKHTTVGIRSWDTEALHELGSEIVNDPEEGWFAVGDPDVSAWLMRDIKAEAEMTKHARRCLMVDPRCSGQTIRDVIAFPASSIREAGSPEDLFKRYARSRGRPSLIESLRTGQLEGWATEYHAPELSALTAGEPLLEVLYTRVPGR